MSALFMSITPEQAASIVITQDELLALPDLDIMKLRGLLWGEGEEAVTVGRKKRKRKKGAGTGVKVGGHTRSPRGPNRGKKRVRVDGYARGSGAKKRKRRKK